MTDFLRLNNIPIPVEDGSAAYSFEEHGSRQRTMDGSLRTTRTSIKRVWAFRTPVLDPEQALMIAGLIAGNGHHFGYDVDAFDLKGFGPLDPAAPLSIYTIRSGVELGLKYGGAVAVEAATTNLLPQNVRTGTDTLANTTGFTHVDPGPLFDSLVLPLPGTMKPAYQGSRVLRFETHVGAPNGFRGGILTNPIAALPATTYAASLYASLGQGGPGAMRMFLRDSVNGIDGTIDTQTPPTSLSDKWARFRSVVTTGGGAPQLSILFLEDVVDTGFLQIWADAFQIEQQPKATSWFDGARGAGLLRNDVQSFVSSGRTISEDIRTAIDFTVMFWARRDPAGFPAGRRGLFAITQDVGGIGLVNFGHTLFATISDNVFNALEVFSGADDLGGAATLQLASIVSWPEDTWKHVAVVVRRNSIFGSDPNRLKLYFNGVLVGETVAAGALPDFSLTKALYVGGTGVTDFLRFSGGLIDDLVVVPYALTAAGINAVFTAGRAFSDLPRLDAEGAGIVTPPPRAIVLGELPTGEFVQVHFSAAITQNARTVEIILTEV